MRLSTISILILSLLVTGCRYAPDADEEYINPIAPPDLEDYNVNLNGIADGDTIRLFGPGNFTYAVTGKGKDVNVKVLLEGKTISSKEGSTGIFGIVQPNLKTGIYELRIEVITNTGTGSLADQFEVEKLSLWKKWTVAIFTDLPTTPTLTFAVQNGYQVLTWPKYTNEYFTRYRLEVKYNSVADRTIDILDPATVSWTDSLYAGNHSATYKLTTTNIVGSRFVESARSREPLDFTLAYNQADSTITVGLPSPVFHQNFGQYRIKENSVERVTAGAAQPTVTFKANKAGHNYSTSILVERHGKVASQGAATLSKTATITVATKKLHKPIERYFFNDELNAIFGYRQITTQADQLVRYDIETLAPVDSFMIGDIVSIDIPYRGQFAYFSRDQMVFQLNWFTGVQKTISPFTIGSGPSSLSASDKQTVCFGWFRNGTAPGSLILQRRIHNMLTDQTIYSETITHVGGSSVPLPKEHIMSDDGVFMRNHQSAIYRLDGASPQTTGSVTVNTWVGFREDKSDEILISNGNVVNIYDATSSLFKRKLTAPASSFFKHYDVAARRLIFTDNTLQQIHTIDIDTQVLKSYNVNLSNIFIANGMLITTQGDYFKLY